MKFRNFDEYFEAIRILIEDLDKNNKHNLSDQIKEGKKCLNGLTDGLAMFYDRLESIIKWDWDNLSNEEKIKISEITDETRRITFRE